MSREARSGVTPGSAVVPAVVPAAVAAVLAAVLVAVAGVLVVVPGPARANAQPAKLTASQRLGIATSPHPYLMHACDVGLHVAASGISTRTTGTRRTPLVVAQTTCFGATAASPTDTGVYDRSGRQRYLIDTGRTFHRGKRWVTPIAVRKLHRGVVAVVYGGYLDRDPMCCPSRLYERVFRLHGSGATHGKLHRVPIGRAG